MQRLSLAKWKREGKQYFKQHTRLFETLFNNVRHEIVSEHANDLYPNLLIKRTAVSRVRKTKRQCKGYQEQ